jgi:integrase
MSHVIPSKPFIKLVIRPSPPVTTVIPYPLQTNIICTPLTIEQYQQREEEKKDAKSANTHKSYLYAWDTFWHFCCTRYPGVTESQLNTDYLWIYIKDMEARELKASTIQTRISGIKHLIQLKGLEANFRFEALKVDLEGLYRRIGTRKVGQSPILQEQLHKMIDAIGIGMRHWQILDRALLLITWYSGIRKTESCALKWNDIEDKPGGIIIHIGRSKTDQKGIGQQVPIISYDSAYCPILHLYQWKSYTNGTGYVWRTVATNNKISEEPLGDQAFYRKIKKYCSLIGLDPASYSPHSLRSGVLTQGSINGAPMAMLLQQSRHRSIKSLDSYIRPVDMMSNNLGQFLNK